MKTMLVGLCGTPFSRAAADQAIELAAETGAALLGLCVVEGERLCPAEPAPQGEGGIHRQRDEAAQQAAHEHARGLIADFERACREAGVTARTLDVEGGAAETLCTEAQRVDLLVVGKKHFRDDDWEASSHTLRCILHQSPRPVLCVPAAVAQQRPALIAYDGSLQSAKVLQLFIYCGLQENREVHLLTIADDARAVAERGLEMLAAHGIHAQPHLREGNHAGEQILLTAGRLDAGLIVMGAYGRPRFREFLFGSVTRELLKRTRVPLFLYH